MAAGAPGGACTKTRGTFHVDIYQAISQQILQQLETGVMPWRKPWPRGLPRDLTTGKDFRGINILMLSAAPFASRYWITVRDVQRLGGCASKNEKTTPIIYCPASAPERKRSRQEKPGLEQPTDSFSPTIGVVNLEQVQGISRPEDDVPCRPDRRLEMAEGVFEVMPGKPTILHSHSRLPAYSSSRDEVIMPHLSQFKGPDDYYRTLFRGLVCSTGHARRLNRVGAVSDHSEQSTFERLVAEFGAAFLCAFTGIDITTSQTPEAGQIDRWANAIRKDSRLVFRAASAAQQAADYIRGKVVVEQSPATPAPQLHPGETLSFQV